MNFRILIISILFFTTSGGLGKPLSGAFIQISPYMWDYNQADWNQEIRLMSEAGLDTVIITPIIDEGKAHYPSTLPFVTQVTDNGIEMILTACDIYNVKCYVGLINDNRWWNAMGNESLLAIFAQNDIACADELLPIVNQHPSFAAWYVPEEIVFNAWQGNMRTQLINILLKPLVNHLKSISPGKLVANAPYVYEINAGAEACGQWWDYTLSQVGFDILMWQDGFGASATRQPEEVVPYFRALSQACANNGIQFWNDLEVFNQSDDFSTKPYSEVKWQIELNDKYVDKIVTWEWFYITPTQQMRGDTRTTDRQNLYVQLYAQNKNYKLASLNKNYTSNRTPNASYPDVKHELTDSQVDFEMDTQTGFLLSGTQDVLITIDLRENVLAKYGFAATIMKRESWDVYLPSNVSVYISKDNISYSYLTELKTFPASGDSLNVYYAFPQNNISARYVKFRIRATGWLMCSELSVFRTPPAGDYNADYKVNIHDLNELASEWLSANNDGTRINFQEFNSMAENWNWKRIPKETFRSKFYNLKNYQITQDSPYMQGRSAESVASELAVNGVESIFIIPTSTDGFIDGIVSALHERGIGAGLMIFADCVYTDPEILPTGWQSWQMQFLNGPSDLHLSFIYPAFRQWMKQRAVNLCNTNGFDAITFAEPMYPIYDGVTKNPVIYADVSPGYQAIFKADTGETSFPNFTNPSSPAYFETNTALYQKLVQHRKDSITNYFDEIINGTNGLRQAAPDTLVITWSLACSKLENGGVQLLPEWEGNDAYSIVKKSKPDIHYFQTHWPDWSDPTLSSEYVYQYIDNFKEAWRAMPDVAIGVQNDIGSWETMRRSNQYYDDFLSACRASNVSNSTCYCFDIRSDIYEAAPQLKRISRSAGNMIRLEFNERIHSNSAQIMRQRTIVNDSDIVYNVVSATVDGNLLKLQLDKQIEDGEILSVDISGISDDPSVRWVTPKISAGNTNTVPAGTIVQLIMQQ
jgi:hypothetical protein